MVGIDASRERIGRKLLKWGATNPNFLIDYAQGLGIIRFDWKGSHYEFRYKSKNATDAISKLSWSLARLIDCDIRGILPFSKTGREYLALPSPSDQQFPTKSFDDTVGSKWFAILGLNSHASNEEVKKKYRLLAGMYHPDRALKEDDKTIYETKFNEVAEAYNQIKKIRGEF